MDEEFVIIDKWGLVLCARTNDGVQPILKILKAKKNIFPHTENEAKKIKNWDWKISKRM